MRNIKEKAAAGMVAAAILLTGCSRSERSVDSGSSANNANPAISSFAEGDDESSKPESAFDTQPNIDTETADSIPQSGVTDASTFTYHYDSDLGGIVISGYLGNSFIIQIPDTIDGEPVTAIDFGAFGAYNTDSSHTTSITIPDSVTKIGGYAFEGCTSLTSINIPDDVTVIEYCAFAGCTGLTSIAIPDGVTKIEWGAFESCTSLTSVTLPDSVTEIGNDIFKGCTSLTSVAYKGETYDYEHISDLYDAITGN